MFNEDAMRQEDSCGAPVANVENKECFEFKQSQSNKSSPVNVVFTPQQDNTGWNQYLRAEIYLNTPPRAQSQMQLLICWERGKINWKE